MDRTRIREIVAGAAAEVNASQPASGPLRPDDDVPLAADGGQLTSLALITFILAVEERLAEALSKSVLLFDETLIADPNGPFRTIGSLLDHIEGIVEGDASR